MMLDGVYCIDVSNTEISRLPEIDIVFIHGLSSSADAAWKNDNGDLWPIWLRPFLGNVRILLLNYPAPALFANRFANVSISERARNLADFLPTIGIGNRPSIFICHSLGGILIKEILRCCVTTGCSINIATNTIGIVFLATPHGGSNATAWTDWIGSSLIPDLALNSEYLKSLKEWFVQYIAQTQIPISAYYETQRYKTVIVVKRESADPGCDNCNVIPLDYDHCTIAKPLSPNAD
jgi:pimeloyl-ACP methyl ester carboxylesterase